MAEEQTENPARSDHGGMNKKGLVSEYQPSTQLQAPDSGPSESTHAGSDIQLREPVANTSQSGERTMPGRQSRKGSDQLSEPVEASSSPTRSAQVSQSGDRTRSGRQSRKPKFLEENYVL